MPHAVAYLPGYFQEVAREHGDLACLAAGPARVFLLSSAELAQDLLVDHDHLFQKGRGVRPFTRRLLGEGVLGSEGDIHRRQHELLVPVLHGPALEPFAGAVTAGGERMQATWVDGQSVDVFADLARTTTEIMIEDMFGVSVEQPDGWELTLALAEAVDALEHAPLPFIRGVERLPLHGNRRFERARSRLDRVVLRMVRECREAPGDHVSLLAALVRVRHPEGDTMPDRKVRDEALSIFRGHKTGGTALCWAWYLLARHPGVEARVLGEIDAVCGDRVPTGEDVARLSFCRMVVDEACACSRRPGPWPGGRSPTTTSPASRSRPAPPPSPVPTSSTATRAIIPIPGGSTPSGSSRSAGPDGIRSRTSRSGEARRCAWETSSPRSRPSS